MRKGARPTTETPAPRRHDAPWPCALLTVAVRGSVSVPFVGREARPDRPAQTACPKCPGSTRPAHSTSSPQPLETQDPPGVCGRFRRDENSVCRNAEISGFRWISRPWVAEIQAVYVARQLVLPDLKTHHAN